MSNDAQRSSEFSASELKPGKARRHRKSDSHAESRLRLLIYRVILVAVVLCIWQVASGSSALPNYAVSNPHDIAVALWQFLHTSAGWADIQTTSTEIVEGFLSGVAIGVVGALILGSMHVAGRVFEPFIAALNSIPKIALAPLFLLFFGIGELSKVAIAATMVAFIVFYNLYYGMRTVSHELENIVKLMGGGRWDLLRYVTLPSLVTPFFAGLKTGAPLAVIAVIIGEFLASFNGIGHVLLVDGQDLDASGVFAGIAILVVISLAINGLITALDSLVSRQLGLSSKNSRRPVK